MRTGEVMRDLTFIGSSAIWIVLTRSVKRVPFWQLREVRVDDVGFIPDQRPAGCMMLLCLEMGGAIGVSLALTITDILLRDPYQFRNGGVPGLDGFGRLATVVGGLRGGYVGSGAVGFGSSCFASVRCCISHCRSRDGCSEASNDVCGQ